MAQCKDCIHGEICDMFAHTRTLICTDRADKMCKMFKSMADVVPKSEYDRLEKLYNDMTQEAKGYLNRLYGIRADVAREIFEEIDVLVDDWKHCYIQSIQFIAELAELKKKYMEAKE